MADLMTLKKFEALGPFEIKNELINLAKATSKTTQSAFLNAGRGNPNWVATTPREGFFLLGQFAITESKRSMEESPGIGGMPQAKGIAARLDAWLAKHMDMPGADFLSSMVKFAIKTFGFDPDAFVHELVDSIIGDNYPVPDRMLVHNERIVHEYLMWAMCGKPRPSGKFDLYAVEGGTAAMCYIFKSLKANRLLFPGDTIALGTPIFTPYLEMTHLEDYDLKMVQSGRRRRTASSTRTRKSRSWKIRRSRRSSSSIPAIPAAWAMSRETIAKIVKLVKTKRPDLMLLTDDVYGTFVDDFRSLLGELPQNTIGVYSYSKYFGCTGWRLGVIAVHEDNIFDKMIAKLPDRAREGAGQALRPDHAGTAQIQIHRSHRSRQSRHRPQPHRRAFAAAAGDDDHVLALRNDGCEEGLPEGLHGDRPSAHQAIARGHGPSSSRRIRTSTPTTALIDFEFWARKNIGDEAVEYLKKNIHPLDLAFRLAEAHGIVLLNGGGFEAPNWSLRVSLGESARRSLRRHRSRRSVDRPRLQRHV